MKRKYLSILLMIALLLSGTISALADNAPMFETENALDSLAVTSEYTDESPSPLLEEEEDSTLQNEALDEKDLSDTETVTFKANSSSTDEQVEEGKAKIQVNFWRMIPNKKDITALIFGKRYTVYTKDPATGKKIYGSYKDSTAISIPEALLGKWKKIISKLNLKVSLNDVYELEVPATKKGTEYKVYVSCNNRGLTTVDDHSVLIVKSGKTESIGFQVVELAEPLKIISTFSDGKNRDVKYKITKESGGLLSGIINTGLGWLTFSGKNGTESVNLKKLAEGISYKIKPDYVPEGFTAKPSYKTVTAKKKGESCEPVEFKFTRQQKAAIRVKFKTGRWTKPSGENPYTIEILDKNGSKLNLPVKKLKENLYEIIVSPKDKETAYKITVKCNDDNFTLRQHYQTVSIKENETKQLDFDVQKVSLLDITSKFSDGEDREVTYRAVSGNKKAGTVYEGNAPMKLYSGETYTITPIKVPEGFTVKTPEQTTETKQLGYVFKPMVFEYIKAEQTKILVKIKGLSSYKANADVRAVAEDNTVYKGLRNSNGDYEIYVPATDNGTTYKVEAQCKDNKFTLKDTYQKITVMHQNETTVSFKLMEASTLDIKSIFPEGYENTKVNYIAKRTDNTEERGAVYSDMSKLCLKDKYEITPSPMPKGFTAESSSKTTETMKKGWKIFSKTVFKPITFNYEKKMMGTLTLKAVLKDNEQTPLENITFKITNTKGTTFTAEDLQEEIDLDTYTVEAVFDADEYELTEGQEQSRTIELSKDNPNKTETFIFQKAPKGSLTIKAIDENNTDLSNAIRFEVKKGDTTVTELNELKLGTYQITANFDQEKYELADNQSNPVTVILNRDNLKQELIFRFTKVEEKANLVAKISNVGKIENPAEKFDVYLVDENYNKIDDIDCTKEIKTTGWGITTNLICTFKVPVGEEGKDYTVQVDCKADGYAMTKTYKKTKVTKDNAELNFIIGAAMSELTITSVCGSQLMEGVSYQAIDENNTENEGSIIKDMKHIYKIGSYIVSPISVPEGYTVSPSSQKIKKSGLFTVTPAPMTFNYTKK